MADVVGDSIIICGQRFEVPGTRCVNFVDNPRWLLPFKASPEDAAREGRDSYYHRRVLKTKKGRRFVGEDLALAREAIDAIVLHADGLNSVELTYKVFVNRVVSSHFCIAADGTVYQHLDAGNVTAHHCRGHNGRSVGVDLNNDLVRLHEDDGLPYNYPKSERGRPELKRSKSKTVVINGYARKTYGYTGAQYEALVKLLDVLCTTLGIEKEFPLDASGEIVMGKLEAPEGFRGICGHWHTEVAKWDPGPGFDWQRVYQVLRGQGNSFPVLQPGQKNVRELRDVDELSGAASGLFHAVETGEGGFYPMGVNQNWHGGVHVRAPSGSDVHAMFSGVVVAARFGDADQEEPESELGDNNFVLLRHDIPLPLVDWSEGAKKDKEESEDDEAATRVLTVYSLYMHLVPLDIDGEAERKDFGWLASVHQRFGNDDDDEGKEPSVDEDEDEEEGDRFVSHRAKPYLEVDSRLSALRAGKVALFDWEEPDKRIEVAAGQRLGRVGRFSEGVDEELGSLVHVEVFADRSWKEALDLGQHSRFWTELEEDTDSNLRVETEDVLGLFASRRSRRRPRSFFRRKARELAAETIRDFYVEGEASAKRWLRTTITYHVSEWSDRVDWVRALSEAQEWSDRRRDYDRMLSAPSRKKLRDVFSREIKKFLPFVWLTGDVATHVGLEVGEEWNGQLYHFHPLHFLWWLTFYSNQGAKKVYRGKSYRELVEERRLERKLEEQIAAGVAPLDDEDLYGDHHTYDDDWLAELDEEEPSEVLLELRERKPAPDEWKILSEDP